MLYHDGSYFPFCRQRNPEPLQYGGSHWGWHMPSSSTGPLMWSCGEDGFGYFPSTSDLRIWQTFSVWTDDCWHLLTIDDPLIHRFPGKGQHIGISRILFVNSTHSFTHSFTQLHLASISKPFLAMRWIDLHCLLCLLCLLCRSTCVRTCWASWRISPQSRWRVSGKSGPSSMGGTIYGIYGSQGCPKHAIP